MPFQINDLKARGQLTYDALKTTPQLQLEEVSCVIFMTELVVRTCTSMYYCACI